MNTLAKYRYPTTLRSDVFGPLEQVFDSFFNDFFKNSNLDKVKAFAGYPKIDVSRENDNIILRAAIPGVKPDDVKVEMIDDYTVEISGKMSEEYSSTENSYSIKELSKRAFSRQLNFGQEVGDPIEASIKDGILTLKWQVDTPKEPEKRMVKITTA